MKDSSNYFSDILTWRQRRPPKDFLGPPQGSPRVAFIMNRFPNLTETFVYRELDSLRACGVDVLTFSIRRPKTDEVSREAWRYFPQTHYILPLSIIGAPADHWRAFVSHPLRYLKIALEVVTGTHDRWQDRLRSLCHFAEAMTLVPIIRAGGIEHVHAHFAVGSTTCAWVLSRFLNLPFSFTAHAYDIWRDRLLLSEKLHDATFVVTCTKENGNHLEQAYPSRRAPIRVVHHGVDSARFVPEPRPSRTACRILSVGRLCEQKGFPVLLQACARLLERGRNFECHIIGEGPLRPALERLSQDLGLQGHVRLLGRVFQEEMPRHYLEADIFVLACTQASDNDRDGIPNTVMEAMASGLPVVSTWFAGLPELVVDGTTGLLVPRDDPAALAEALVWLLEDESVRRKFGAAGRERVLREFSMERAARSLSGMFRCGVSQTEERSASAPVEVRPI